MKVKLAFYSALVLAVIGAHAAEGALFYFFATHLLAASAGLFMLRLEHTPRDGGNAGNPKRKPSSPPSKMKAG